MRPPTSSSSGPASAARSPRTTSPPAARASSCSSAGRGWRPRTSPTTCRSARTPGSSTCISGDGSTSSPATASAASSVVYFAASLRAPRFVFERRGTLGPAALAGVDHPPHARPLVRPRRGDPAGRPADLGRRPVRRRRVGGGLRARRAHLQPGAGGRRPPDVHQLQLDAHRLPLRREALDAAQLPAGRASARRARSARCTRCRRSARRHDAGLPLPGRLHQLDPDDYRVSVGAGVDRGEDRHPGGRRDGHAGDPAALGGGPRRHARGGRPLLLPQRRPGHDGGARRGQGRASSSGLERAPGVAYEAFPIGKPIGSMSFDYLDASAARVRALRARSRSTSRRSRTSCPRTAPTATAGLVRHRQADLTARWRSWLTVLAMTEDDNEGVFGPPPPTGNFIRVAPAASARPAHATDANAAHPARLGPVRRGDPVDRRAGRPRPAPARGVGGQRLSVAHPLSSCRIGDDPATSALDHRHELRGHPGHLRHRRRGGADVALRQPVAHDRRARRARVGRCCWRAPPSTASRHATCAAARDARTRRGRGRSC